MLKEPFQPDAANESDRDFCAAKLTQALQRLSPEHREVIVLRYYENLKVQDIAAQIGVSKGTVKSRLHYAVRCLEKFLPVEMNLFASEGTHNQMTSCPAGILTIVWTNTWMERWTADFRLLPGNMSGNVAIASARLCVRKTSRKRSDLRSIAPPRAFHSAPERCGTS